MKNRLNLFSKKLSAASLFFLLTGALLVSCSKTEELSLEEIESVKSLGAESILSRTVSKPYNNQKFVPGKVKGVWNDTLLDDPKTFNILIAERDGNSSSLCAMMQDYLVDYDTIAREWKPRCASFEIEADEKTNTLTVHYTLRDDMYWSWYGSDKKVPVTADDIVWWYNEIEGDPESNSSGYGGQFILLEDGTEAHVDCVKTGEKTFDYIFPRIVAEPLLATNGSLVPSFVYREAKEKGGMQAVKDLFSVACDVKTIPSCGKWFLTEYTPAQRLVYTRNPDYWEKDENGISYPYYEQEILQIVGDEHTDLLMFKQGKTEQYGPSPEELDDVINDAGDKYTVYNAEGSDGASMWSFNQNPLNKDKPFYKWFTQKEFRQAMSCLLNRDRIIDQVYRGLAQPKYDFFPESNPYYNPKIQLQYKYDIAKAESLLEKCGMKKDKDGILHDSDGNAVEYDLEISTSNSTLNDIAQIISDECSKVGVKVNIRQVDFQKMVEQLTGTYDWQSLIIGLGTNRFPSQGSNVWPSDGNLHLWYPYQETPATDWEARLDYVYNEGSYTVDKEQAQKYWDEENEIILEQCPVIYLLRSRSFFAINNRWDQTNVYFDNKEGLTLKAVFLKD